jgi:hypothetical protein
MNWATGYRQTTELGHSALEGGRLTCSHGEGKPGIDLIDVPLGLAVDARRTTR